MGTLSVTRQFRFDRESSYTPWPLSSRLRDRHRTTPLFTVRARTPPIREDSAFAAYKTRHVQPLGEAPTTRAVSSGRFQSARPVVSKFLLDD